MPKRRGGFVLPELPEVETVRQGLHEALVGRRLLHVRATGARSVRRVGLDAFNAEFAAPIPANPAIAAVDRHGKYLLIRLDDGRTVVVHLRMSGQLLLARPDAPALPHTHVVADLDDGLQVRFVDPRTFGEWFVTGGTRPPELGHLGPDAWLELPEPRALRQAALARRVALKVLLTDQRYVSGLGNIYADEILFAARLDPCRLGASLGPRESVRLHDGIVTVLARAIELGGSTLADQQYVGVDGAAGRFQHEHAVYGRRGAPCVRCGSAVVRRAIGARSAFACPRCQR